MKKKVIKGLLLLAIGMATMFQQILMPAGASAAYQEMPFITTNLGFPWKIAVEDDGNILVADAVYSTVYRFNSDGSNIINPVYKDIYSFKYPVVALDENEDIVIGDVYDNKISRISAQSGDIFDIIQIPNEYSLSAVYANVYGIYAVGNYLGLYHVDGHGAVAQKLDAIDLGITEAQDIVGKADGTLYISGFVRDVYYYDALNGIYYYDYVGRIVKVTLAGGVYTPSIIYSIRDAVIYGIGADNNDGIYFTETNISISNPYYQVVKRINRDGTVDVVLQSDGLTLPLDVGFTTIGETEKNACCSFLWE